MKNWARFQKSNNFKAVQAFSSSILVNCKDTEFSLHLATGFRLPDLSMLNTNNNLKAEEAYGGNFGVSQKTNLGVFNILLFRTRYKQQMVFVGPTPVNINSSKQQGLELGWQNKIGVWCTHFSYTYAESVQLNPLRNLPNIPRKTANAKLVYEKNDCSFGVGLRYIGKQTQADFESGKPGFENAPTIKRGGFSVIYSDMQYKVTECATWQTTIENALARKIESLHGYQNPGFQICTSLGMTW